jgi:hypothetical protein
MNSDLAMDTADQKLLKSTGADNLWMVFGEPDLELRTLPNGKLQVELRGLDVHDPTSGEIRSSSTDEIACRTAHAGGAQSIFAAGLHRGEQPPVTSSRPPRRGRRSRPRARSGTSCAT